VGVTVDRQIISIGGASRSGSTMLALLLGEIKGVFSVGELRYVWSRGYLDNMLCGCGMPFRDCEFWDSVFKEAYGGFDRVPITEIRDLHRVVTPIWRLPELLSPVRRHAFSLDVEAYLAHLKQLTEAIYQVSGARIILDSSKLPSYCALLGKLETSITWVHLVRDSRAVAYSQMKKKPKPDARRPGAYMRRFSPFESARDWDVLNASMELLRVTNAPFRFMRYEDLVVDPLGRLTGAFPEFAKEVAELLVEPRLRLHTNHTVSGNPIRLAPEGLEIRLDAEWNSLMRPSDRRAVTVLTWPLLAHYGYPIALGP
jgi:hypothetical protein